MLTLCTMALLEEAANLGHEYTGGFDGLPSITIPPLFGLFEFNPLFPKTQYLYVLGVLFICFVFVRTLVYSPFGQSLTGIRENILRMHAVGAPVRRRLVICYTISAALAGIAGGAVGAGQRLRQPEHARPRPRGDRADRAGARRLWPALWRLRRRRRLHGAVALSVEVYPTAWQLGLGLMLMIIALFARNGIIGLGETLMRVCAGSPTAPPHDRPLLETRNLSRNFGALRASRDINFVLEAGARHALIGPNGAGKTTFINLLTGVLRPSVGTVLLKGRRHHPDAAGRAGQARHRPHLPDQPAVPRALGAGERLHRGRRAGRRRATECAAGRLARDVIDEAMHLLDTLKLDDDAHRTIAELPYGRQRLVEMAIALGLKPEVLLLDEPAAGVPSAESHIILDAIDACPRSSACSSSITTWTWCSALPSASPCW